MMAFAVLTVMATLWPFVYVFSMSVSDPTAVLRRDVWLLPVGFSLDAYANVLQAPGVGRAYLNTVFYTVAGTVLNVILTVMVAYPLSRRFFLGRKPIMIFIVLTMFFSGGLIPTFLVVRELGIYNTPWAMILPSAVSAFLVIIARSFFERLPDGILEAARIDGASEVQILTRIVLPLSKPLVALLCLFYAVANWNSYFPALVYLPSPNLQPLSLFLNNVLVQGQSFGATTGAEGNLDQVIKALQMKYALIIVVILPIVAIYPFFQKHFTAGALIGGVKD